MNQVYFDTVNTRGVTKGGSRGRFTTHFTLKNDEILRLSYFFYFPVFFLISVMDVTIYVYNSEIKNLMLRKFTVLQKI